MALNISRDQYLEAQKLSWGAFNPLQGFMNELDLIACANHGRLSNGAVFPVPIVLDVSKQLLDEISVGDQVELKFEGRHVGSLKVESIYEWDKDFIAKSILGTNSLNHPGVIYYKGLNDYLLSGPVQIHFEHDFEFSKYEIKPEVMKLYFKRMGWKSIAGFQTRNVPHTAHEYLQRVALQMVDGLLIQPLVGKKKKGDFSPAAIIRGYEALIENFYPQSRVTLSILSTVMRYAGPREAVFHSIIRRNYGCTHFIVGRDHAGVGNFYSEYAAHDYISQFEKELGIEIIKLMGPYYCSACDEIVTEKSCKHKDDPVLRTEVSGTLVREMIANKNQVDKRFMRQEVLDALIGIEPFIGN